MGEKAVLVGRLTFSLRPRSSSCQLRLVLWLGPYLGRLLWRHGDLHAWGRWSSGQKPRGSGHPQGRQRCRQRRQGPAKHYGPGSITKCNLPADDCDSLRSGLCEFFVQFKFNIVQCIPPQYYTHRKKVSSNLCILVDAQAGWRLDQKHGRSDHHWPGASDHESCSSKKITHVNLG